MNPIDDAPIQDGPELGIPMPEQDALPQPGPLLTDLFSMPANEVKPEPGELPQDDFPEPSGNSPALGVSADPYSPKRPRGASPASNVIQLGGDVMRRMPGLTEEPFAQVDPLDTTMSTEQLIAELKDRASATQGSTLADNYLAGITSDFQAALEQVPGLSDDHKALAQALFNHHVIMAVAANPSFGGDLEALNQIRLMASQRSASGFSADWSRLVSAVPGKDRDALVVVHDLAANLYRSHDNKIVSTMERLASRQEATGPQISTGLGLASGLGAVVGGLTNAGHRFFTEMRRRVDKGLQQRRAPGEEYGEHGAASETVDVDVNAWRSAKAASLALEVQRLVGEISTKAGDIDWENGRGHEAAADLKLAVEGLGEMAEEGALEQVQSASVKQVLSEAAQSMEESEKRMRTVQLRDLVAGLSAAITNLAGRVFDSVRSIAQSVTGSPDASPNTPPAPGDAEAKSLEPDRQPQHHARTMPRP